MVSGEQVVAAGAVGLLASEATGVTNLTGGGGGDGDDGRDEIGGGGGMPGFNLGGLELPAPAAPSVDLGGIEAGGRSSAADFAGVAEAMAEAMGEAAEAGAQTAQDTASDATGEATGAVGDRLVGPLGGLTDGVVGTAAGVTGAGPTGDVANLLRADPNELGAQAGAATASVGTGFVGGTFERVDAGMEEAARRLVVEGLYMGDEGQTAESRAEELKNRYGGGDKLGLGDIARAAGAQDPTDPATIRESANWWANLGPDMTGDGGGGGGGGGILDRFTSTSVDTGNEWSVTDAVTATVTGEDPHSTAEASPDVDFSEQRSRMFGGSGDTVGGSDGRGDGRTSRTTDEPNTSQATASAAEEVEKRLSVPTTGGTAVMT